MKIAAFFALAALPFFNLFAQNEKAATGAKPLQIPQSAFAIPHSTRALVVGVSDYQSKDIPDLRFADRDAEAFASWLRSPAGGSVAEDDILLLTNEKATVAAVGTALFAALDECAAGDRFVFYFSGHGDVESKTRSQPGYLLCHDSPANVYMVGALNLRDLQEIVSTLSEKGVAVTLITDACHAGKLAGAGIGGTQATAAALAKQFAGEVKIMSCQPNELSIESEQWGGGRGVFSWFLESGLTGLADRNGDGEVSLFELTRFLQDEVPAATAPHSQIPMTVGDLGAKLNRVDAPSLFALKKAEKGRPDTLGAFVSKGLEDEILKKTDATTRERYLFFKKQLAARAFFEPKDACADGLFRQLLEAEDLAPLLGLMRRNFAVALLDEVQQAINALLDNDPYEANRWRFNPSKYANYPSYLARSMELLGEKHYLRRALEAKKRYFEGYNLLKNVGELENDPARRDSCKRAARAHFLASLDLEPAAAYVFFAMGQSFSQELNSVYQTDSVRFWCEKAVESSPAWLMPYLEISNSFGSGDFDLLANEKWLNKALAIAPESYMTLERFSWLKQLQNKADESLALNKKMIALRPEIFNAYSTTAYTLTYIKGDYFESEKYCLQSLALEPNQLWWAYSLLGIDYFKTGRTTEAIEHFKKGLARASASSVDKNALLAFLVIACVQSGDWAAAEDFCKQADSMNLSLPGYNAYRKMAEGKLYFLQNRLDLAEKTLQNVFVADPTTNGAWGLAWALLAEIEVKKGRLEAAENLFKKGITVEYIPDRGIFFDEALFRYGQFLLHQNRLAEAETQFLEIEKATPRSWFFGYGMAILSAKKGEKKAALDWLEKSLEHFWPDEKAILEEPLFSKIKKTKRFGDLMKTHFSIEK